MHRKLKSILLLTAVAALFFYLGATSTKQITAQSERRTDPQGRFFPTPQTNLPKQKAGFGAIGRIAMRIDQVSQGSTAESLGLRAGNYLVEIDGKQFYSSRDIFELLGEKSPGDEVEISYIAINPATCRLEYKKEKSTMLALKNK
jgi:S1-C subfamily serine protease